MSAAHDLLARPARAPARAAIGAETVVELVSPRWRWRIITPGQWRLLSRLGRRARVRDLAQPGGADVAEVVELVTELVAAGFLVAEEQADRAEPPAPVAEPDEPVAELSAAPAAELIEEPPAEPIAEPIDEPEVELIAEPGTELIAGPIEEPSAAPAEALVAEPVHEVSAEPVHQGESAPVYEVEAARAAEPVEPWAEPGPQPPAELDVEWEPEPVAELGPRSVWADPVDVVEPASPSGVRPYAPVPVPPRPAPGAHRADPAAEAYPSAGEELHVLPRREPGRALSPIANVLQQRHEQLRRMPGEEPDGPNTETLRRLLGSLQQMEEYGPAERGGAG
jgi:hypothetical protein